MLSSFLLFATSDGIVALPPLSALSPLFRAVYGVGLCLIDGDSLGDVGGATALSQP